MTPVSVAQDGPVLEVVLRGEIDSANASAVTDVLRKPCDAAGRRSSG